ncbi:MAG: IS630 transposase-related protein [Wolbachia sp.]
MTKNSEHTLTEMKQNLGFGTNSIWYRLKQLRITLKKSHHIKSAIKKIGSDLPIKS